VIAALIVLGVGCGVALRLVAQTPLLLRPYASGRHMRQEGVPGMTRFDNEGCSDRLLSQVLIQDVGLNAFHELESEESRDGQVHAAVHQSE
jgi:hypothetical protein